jgi:hypothetical protein
MSKLRSIWDGYGIALLYSTNRRPPVAGAADFAGVDNGCLAGTTGLATGRGAGAGDGNEATDNGAGADVDFVSVTVGLGVGNDNDGVGNAALRAFRSVSSSRNTR